LQLIEGDACRVKLDEIYPDGYKMISNLPYSAGTVVVANLLDSPNPPEEMVIMLQKEVALRLAAEPGTHDYGALSVRVQVLYEPTPLRIAPPEMFHPRPEVDSCVIRLKRLQNPPSQEYRKKLSRLVRLAFGQRRKKMIKQLAGAFGRDVMDSIYAETGLKEDIRAERVTVEQFRKITDLLLERGL
jgi:16S rRNA (adenine1518-N6/adenine1519-N6)-dimethyltransferase